MALELLLKNVDFYEYTLCPGPPPIQFPTVKTPGYCVVGRPYYESIAYISSFVYNAATDRYWLVTTNYAWNFPGVEISFSIINPETGVIESRERVGFPSLARSNTSTAYNGGLHKLYAGFFFGPYMVVEITTPYGVPTLAQQANPTVTIAQIPTLAASNYGLLVAPENKLITIFSGIAAEGIVVYDYSPYPSAAIRKWGQPFPSSFAWSAGYESEERVWGLFSETNFGAPNSNEQVLLKYNFLHNRIELLSELQKNAVPDRDARICFDTKRKKLAAVRIKADLANGQHVNAFEVYAPRPAMTQITVPVAITRLSPGMKVSFRAHLIGSKAEAGGLRPLSLSKVAATGHLVKTEVPTEISGSAKFEYTTVTEGLTDTVTASYDETKVIV